MRILLTGATGYIGSSVLDTLIASGHEVVAVVRRPDAAARVVERRRDGVAGRRDGCRVAHCRARRRRRGHPRRRARRRRVGLQRLGRRCGDRGVRRHRPPVRAHERHLGVRRWRRDRRRRTARSGRAGRMACAHRGAAARGIRRRDDRRARRRLRPRTWTRRPRHRCAAHRIGGAATHRRRRAALDVGARRRPRAALRTRRHPRGAARSRHRLRRLADHRARTRRGRRRRRRSRRRSGARGCHSRAPRRRLRRRAAPRPGRHRREGAIDGVGARAHEHPRRGRGWQPTGPPEHPGLRVARCGDPFRRSGASQRRDDTSVSLLPPRWRHEVSSRGCRSTHPPHGRHGRCSSARAARARPGAREPETIDGWVDRHRFRAASRPLRSPPPTRSPRESRLVAFDRSRSPRRTVAFASMRGACAPCASAARHSRSS